MAGIKKKVDVICYRPFMLGIAKFSGSCDNITLDADSIQICLEHKALVKEVLKNGKRVPLDFSNFNKKNPMGFDIDNNDFTDDRGSRQYDIKVIDKEHKHVNTVNVESTYRPLPGQPPVKSISASDIPVQKVAEEDIVPKKIVLGDNNNTNSAPSTPPPSNPPVEEIKKEDDKKETKEDKKDKNNFSNNNNKHHK